MKLALVGIGKIAVDQHIPAIAASEEWMLGATVSRHGSVEGIDSYTDFDQLLAERSDIRVISLCLPPVPRFEFAKKALVAGCLVMLEKPPGATLAECHALAKLAEDNRLSLYATWHSREADKVAVAKAWLADKALKSLKVTWKEDVRRWHPNQDWIWEPGGMGVFDPGINALSIVTEILPVDIHLREATLQVPQNRQTPIAADLAFYHPSGAQVSAVFDWRQEGEQTWTIEAVTDQGTLTLLGKSQPLTLQATWNKSAESPLGGFGRKPYVMGVSARGSFKRSAYGMNYAVANGWVGDEVPLIIEFEAVRK